MSQSTLLESKVNSVTVYTDRAVVKRVATVDLEKGEHSLLFDQLPERLEENSLQLDGRGPAVLGDIRLKAEYYSELPDEKRKVLVKEIENLKEKKRELSDKMALSVGEKSFVENIAARLTGSTEKSVSVELDPDKWIKMVDFYREKLNLLSAEIRETEKSTRKLDEELKKLNKQIRDLGNSMNKKRYQAEIIVEMKAAGKLNLELSYMVYGPSWRPIYDIRVDSDKKSVSISYNAMVKQNTDENWDEVELRLSTAQAHIGGKQPDMSPWHVDIFRAPVRQMKELAKRRGAPKVEPPMQMMSAAVPVEDELDGMFDVPEAEPMEVAEAVVETGSSSVVYAIPGRNTIGNDNDEHKVGILLRDFPGHFRYSTVPRLSPYAYLKAKVVNDSDFSFLAGKTNVFLDNSFVAHSSIDMVSPGEEFWVFLGVDESMKVEHQQLRKYHKKEGVIGKRRVLVYEYLTKITNNKKQKEEIVVWDQIPISDNQEVKINLIEPTYKEDKDSLKMNEKKYLEWFFEMAPGDKQEIPFKFSIEYPLGENLSGLR